MAHRVEAARFWFVESGGPRLYTEAKFSPDDYLVFGRETAGLPKPLLNRERWLRIPMFNAKSRSLNLSNCAALVYLRPCGSRGLKARFVEFMLSEMDIDRVLSRDPQIALVDELAQLN